MKDDCYDDFARFIATSLKGIEEHDGIHIDYVSPINEPDGHWNWLGPKQEGSPATNREVAHVARELNKALIKNKMQTRILVNESSDYRCLLGTHETDWQRGYEINSFFSKDSTKTFLGNQKQVLPLIGGHSYWTNTPIPYMREVRMQLREACRQKGIKFWQTETCIMGNDEEIGGGGGYDFSMKTALYVARISSTARRWPSASRVRHSSRSSLRRHSRTSSRPRPSSMTASCSWLLPHCSISS